MRLSQLVSAIRRQPWQARPVRRPIAVLPARLVVGADRIVRADREALEGALEDRGEPRRRGDEAAERALGARARRVNQNAATRAAR